MSNQTEGHVMPTDRYEFRIFAPDLAVIETRIRARATLSRYRESLETYLLIPGRSDLNLKIRDGVLDLKRLLQRERGLEQWHPEFRQEFPVSVNRLSERLEGHLNLAEPPSELGDWDAARFVHWVADPYIGVGVASLFKQRVGFELDGCLVEIDRLLVNGARLMSAAMESPDSEAVLALQNNLALQAWENVGYVLSLERVLGRTPLPPEAFYNAGLL
jgi:hypothetical protein